MGRWFASPEDREVILRRATEEIASLLKDLDKDCAISIREASRKIKHGPEATLQAFERLRHKVIGGGKAELIETKKGKYLVMVPRDPPDGSIVTLNRVMKADRGPLVHMNFQQATDPSSRIVRIDGYMKIASGECVYARELGLKTIETLNITADSRFDGPYRTESYIWQSGERDNYTRIEVLDEGGREIVPGVGPLDGSVWTNFVAVGREAGEERGIRPINGTATARPPPHVEPVPKRIKSMPIRSIQRGENIRTRITHTSIGGAR